MALEPVRSSRMISQSRPKRTAAAAVWRTWFDCTAPWVTNVVASLASASPSRYSSLRVLLPPPARPVQSSRLIHRFGPPPGEPESASLSSGNGSSGVGRWAKRTGLYRARCMAPPYTEVTLRHSPRQSVSEVSPFCEFRAANLGLQRFRDGGRRGLGQLGHAGDVAARTAHRS